MRDRKPIIYLLVILPILVIGAFSLVAMLILSFTGYRGISVSSIPNMNGILIALPAVFLWIPISLIVSNVIFHAVPFLRKIAEQQVIDGKAPTYAQSQWALLKIAALFAALLVPLIAIGFLA